MAQGQNVTIVVVGKNESGPALKAAAAELTALATAEESANKKSGASYDALGKSAADADVALEKTAGSMRETAKAGQQAVGALGKGAQVIGALGGAIGNTGSVAGQTAEKIAGLASSVAAGGPLAVGMIALTSIVAAAAQAWKALNFETDQAREINDAVEKGLSSRLTAAVDKEREANAKLREELEAYGKTAKQVQLDDAIKRADALTQNTYRLNGEAKQIRDNVRANEELSTAQRETMLADAANLENIAASGEATKRALLERIQILQELIDKEKAHGDAIVAKRAVEKPAHDEALRDLDEYLKKQKAIKEEEEKAAKERAAALAAQGKAIDAFVANRAAKADEQLDFDEGLAKAQDAQIEKSTRQQAAMYNTIAQTSISTLSSIYDAATADNSNMTAQERANARARVAANMAVSIASAVASGASVGWPQNLGAIASGIAAVVAGFAQIASFKTGGVVGGSGLGADRDAVPIIAHRGELVIPADQTRALRSLLGMSGGASMARGGVVAGGGGSNLTVVFNQMVPDSVTNARAVRSIAKQMRKLSSRGMA